MPDSPLHLLLQLMFGESAHISLDLLSQRLLTWAAAFDEWLETRKASQRKYNDSRRAWENLLALVRKPPWDITRADIEGYRAGRRRRKKNGRDPGNKCTSEKSKAPKLYIGCLKSRTNHKLNPKFSNNEGESNKVL